MSLFRNRGAPKERSLLFLPFSIKCKKKKKKKRMRRIHNMGLIWATHSRWVLLWKDKKNQSQTLSRQTLLIPLPYLTYPDEEQLPMTRTSQTLSHFKYQLATQILKRQVLIVCLVAKYRDYLSAFLWGYHLRLRRWRGILETEEESSK